MEVEGHMHSSSYTYLFYTSCRQHHHFWQASLECLVTNVNISLQILSHVSCFTVIQGEVGYCSIVYIHLLAVINMNTAYYHWQTER